MNNSPALPKFRFSWSALLTILLAIVLLYFAFRGVDWGEMLRTVQQGRIEYLVLAFVMLNGSYFLRSLRWWVLLNAATAEPLHPLTVFWGTCIGYLGNYFLPARAGEVIRSALMAQRGNINFMYVVATALTERIIDAALLVLFVITLLPTLMTTIPDWLVTARQAMLVVGFGGFIGLLLAPRLEWLALAILTRLPLPDTLKEKLKNLLEKFLLGVRAFQHPVRGGTFLLLTALIWSLDVVIIIQVAQAFDISMSPAQGLFLLSALGLSSAIPSTPGYIGVYQFVTVSILTPFGVDQNRALVFILAFQAITYLLVLIFGLLGLWRLNTRLAPVALTERELETSG
jgi:uncharacterized protein (TIRG00374 family)